MARYKKNAANQILFAMVKAGDGSFARHAVESDLSLAVPKYFGVTHGTNNATSGAITTMPSLVASGIFRQSLAAALCNFDQALYQYGNLANGSLAEQIIAITFDTANDVDTSAALSDIQSNVTRTWTEASAAHVHAALTYTEASAAHVHADTAQSLASVAAQQASLAHIDAATAATQATNAAATGLVIQSLASVAAQQASLAHIDAGAAAATGLLIQSLASVAAQQASLAHIDAATAATQATNAAATGLVTQSLASVAAQQASLAHIDAANAYTQASQAHVHADTTQSLVSVAYAGLSDQISNLESSFKSRVTSVVTTASDLVSKVWTHATANALVSHASLAYIQASQAHVHADTAQSLASVAAQQSSLAHLDAAAAAATGLLTQSLASVAAQQASLAHIDAATAATQATNAAATGLLIQSLASTAAQQASLAHLDAAAAAATGLLTQSLASEAAEMASKAYVQASLAHIHADATQSLASLAAAGTADIQTRIPAALVGGYLQADVMAINANTVAPVRLALSANQIIPGTVDDTFTPTTIEFEAADITEATADHYNGRIIIFTSGVLAGQATDITDYRLSSGRGHFTVTAITEPPGDTDTFVIV